MIGQAEVIAFVEAEYAHERTRCFPIVDDGLRSIVRSGGIAAIDTADFALREGYALLDLQGMHLWRIQKVERGWRISTDDGRRPARLLTDAEMNAAYLGRAVQVWSPV
jgi:hypothetical protein